MAEWTKESSKAQRIADRNEEIDEVLVQSMLSVFEEHPEVIKEKQDSIMLICAEIEAIVSQKVHTIKGLNYEEKAIAFEVVGRRFLKCGETFKKWFEQDKVRTNKSGGRI